MPSQTLAYWRLEKELRLAKDKLLAKAEECESLEQYRSRLETGAFPSPFPSSQPEPKPLPSLHPARASPCRNGRAYNDAL